jgi:hypothetical protein
MAGGGKVVTTSSVIVTGLSAFNFRDWRVTGKQKTRRMEQMALPCEPAGEPNLPHTKIH